MSQLMVEQSKRIEEKDLSSLSCPNSTATWTPLEHIDCVNILKKEVGHAGYQMEDMEISVMDGWLGNKNDGVVIPDARLFGTAKLVSMNKDNSIQETLGYNPVIGFRNTNDKRFSASMALGSRVMVCDNLCFSGDIMVSRKHVGSVAHRFSHEVWKACLELESKVVKQNERIESYKNTVMWNPSFHDFSVQLIDNKIISASKLPKLLNEWREPRHEEFAPRTVYSAMNCVSELFKAENPLNMTSKGQLLHRVCDKFAYSV